MRWKPGPATCSPPPARSCPGGASARTPSASGAGWRGAPPGSACRSSRSGTARWPRCSSSIPPWTSETNRALRAADAGKATRFAVECLRRGIFTLPHTKLYLWLAHTDADVDWTLDAMEDALRAVA
jgi:hypothetical protein